MNKTVKIDWNKNNNENISLIDLVEENGLEFKKKYIKFVYEVSQNKKFDTLKIDKNFNLWCMSILQEKNFYKSIYIEYVLKIFALNEFLLSNNCNVLIIFDVPRVCKSALRDIEKKFNIKILIKYNNSKNLFLSFKSFIPYVIKSFYTLTKYYFKSFRFKKNDINYKNFYKSKNKNILFVSYLLNFDKAKLNNEEFYSQYWGILPKVLKKNGYVINWLHIFGEENLDLNYLIEKTKNISKKNKNENHFFLEKEFTGIVFFKVIFKYLILIFLNFRLYFKSSNLVFICDDINLWNIFKDECRDSIFGSLAIRNILTFNLFKKCSFFLENNAKCLYLHEGQSWEKSLIYNFKNQSELIGVIQSPIRFWDIKIFDNEKLNNYKTYFPNKLFVNSKYGFEMINEIKNFKNIYKVETLRAKNSYELNFSLRKKYKNKINILFLGGLHIKLTNEVIKSMYDLKNLDKDNKFEIKFRFHQGYVNSRLVDNKDIDNYKDINEAIFNNDVIVATGDTSSSVDAYRLKKNIIIYLGSHFMNINPLRNFTDIKISRNINDLKKQIQTFSKVKNKKFLKIKPYYYEDKNLNRWLKHLC